MRDVPLMTLMVGAPPALTHMVEATPAGPTVDMETPMERIATILSITMDNHTTSVLTRAQGTPGVPPVCIREATATIPTSTAQQRILDMVLSLTMEMTAQSQVNILLLSRDND